MAPELIFKIGVCVCGASAVGAVISVIVLRLLGARLSRQLDTEFGKRRQ